MAQPAANAAPAIPPPDTILFNFIRLDDSSDATHQEPVIADMIDRLRPYYQSWLRVYPHIVGYRDASGAAEWRAIDEPGYNEMRTLGQFMRFIEAPDPAEEGKDRGSRVRVPVRVGLFCSKVGDPVIRGNQQPLDRWHFWGLAIVSNPNGQYGKRVFIYDDQAETRVNQYGVYEDALLPIQKLFLRKLTEPRNKGGEAAQVERDQVWIGGVVERDRPKRCIIHTFEWLESVMKDPASATQDPFQKIFLSNTRMVPTWVQLASWKSASPEVNKERKDRYNKSQQEERDQGPPPRRSTRSSNPGLLMDM